MSTGARPLVIISDFNTGTLPSLIERRDAAAGIAAVAAPFGQVYEVLLDPTHEVWPAEASGALVWTRAEGVASAYGRALAFEPFDKSELIEDVDRFAAAIRDAAARLPWVLVATWTAPPHARGLGLLDLRHERGHARALQMMNAALIGAFTDTPNVYLLEADRWMRTIGAKAFDPKLWYMAKIPFAPAALAEAAADVVAAMRTLRGDSAKVLVLDLDDTLWGGIVGDVGTEGLRLGGHDAVGEAYVDFQKAIKTLARRGVLLAIASKNEEQAALDAIDHHPEMVLRREDFATWRIDWSDKAANIAAMADELNLGLQSFVFIDDNPVERARVRDALPEVFVPDWPADRTKYPRSLLELRCFDQAALSDEDANRTAMYAEERARKNTHPKLGSVKDWVGSLEMKITSEPLNANNLKRAAQLLNKTNQMNLRTRRLSEAELEAWAQSPDHHFYCLSVSDKFGDSGLTALVGIEIDGTTARLADFVLSCRVMGRLVEETALALAVRVACQAGAEQLEAAWIETPKNRPCRSFWMNQPGFVEAGPGVYRWNLREPFPIPAAITFSAH